MIAATNSRATIALISSLRYAPSVPLPRRLIIPSWSQGKPAIERDSSDSIGRRDQPQAVTRHLFAPLPLTVQQQQQQQQQQQEQLQLSCRPSPQTATASIFAPRTEDMNKGFLTFSEDQPGLTSVYLLSNWNSSISGLANSLAIGNRRFLPEIEKERCRNVRVDWEFASLRSHSAFAPENFILTKYQRECKILFNACFYESVYHWYYSVIIISQNYLVDCHPARSSRFNLSSSTSEST